MTTQRPAAPERGPRHQQHEQRRRTERGPIVETARLLGLQLLAVVGIAALIVVVVALVGPDDRTPGPAAAGTTSGPASTSPAPATGSTTASSSGAPGSSSAPAPPVATATPDATGTGLAKVDVLNQSAPGGSAQTVADRLAGAGWTVGRVDDFHGNVSTTTVYWLTPDRRRQARQVARFLGGVRVQQGFSTLRSGRVSVILVDKL